MREEELEEGPETFGLAQPVPLLPVFVPRHRRVMTSTEESGSHW